MRLICCTLFVFALTLILQAPAAAQGQTLFSAQRLAAAEASENNRFGLSVEIDGSMALVRSAGAGAVEVFTFSLDGGWVRQQTLLPDSGESDGFYGSHLYLDDELALVGSLGGNGYVEVFSRGPGGLTFDQQLVASDGANLDFFSDAQRFGNTIIVGAFGRNGPGGASNHGAAYVFERQGDDWVETEILGPDTPAEGKRFGVSIAVGNGIALIGADDLAPMSNFGPGSVYVFEQVGGSWMQTDRLFSGAAGDGFGRDLALSGDLAVIGQEFGDPVAGNAAGSAFVYHNNSGVLSQVDQLVPSNAQASQQFGIDVDISGDQILVGTSSDFGSGSLFAPTTPGVAGNWTELALFEAPAADQNALYGFQVALDGPFALIGAPREDNGAVVDAGAAYVFDLTTRVFASGFE